MIDDFIPVTHELPGKDIKCYAIADCHVGSAECDMVGLRNLVGAIASDPDAYVFLCGDLIDNGLKDSLTNCYETKRPMEQIEMVCELLEPIKDRILGIVSGNHELRSVKQVDIDPTYVIACRLGVPNVCRTNMCFVRIKLANGKLQNTYSILLMHGSTENKKKKFQYAIEGVDAIITGHTHHGLVERPSKIVWTEHNNIVMREVVAITACSWLKYANSYGSRAMYMPQSVSCPQYIELHYANSNQKERSKITVVW